MSFALSRVSHFRQTGSYCKIKEGPDWTRAKSPKKQGWEERYKSSCIRVRSVQVREDGIDTSRGFAATALKFVSHPLSHSSPLFTVGGHPGHLFISTRFVCRALPPLLRAFGLEWVVGRNCGCERRARRRASRRARRRARKRARKRARRRTREGRIRGVGPREVREGCDSQPGS